MKIVCYLKLSSWLYIQLILRYHSHELGRRWYTVYTCQTSLIIYVIMIEVLFNEEGVDDGVDLNNLVSKFHNVLEAQL